jgi:hypothetical protein
MNDALEPIPPKFREPQTKQSHWLIEIPGFNGTREGLQFKNGFCYLNWKQYPENKDKAYWIARRLAEYGVDVTELSPNFTEWGTI